jgi:hypothetical protein
MCQDIRVPACTNHSSSKYTLYLPLSFILKLLVITSLTRATLPLFIVTRRLMCYISRLIINYIQPSNDCASIFGKTVQAQTVALLHAFTIGNSLS